MKIFIVVRHSRKEKHTCEIKRFHTCIIFLSERKKKIRKLHNSSLISYIRDIRIRGIGLYIIIKYSYCDRNRQKLYFIKI